MFVVLPNSDAKITTILQKKIIQMNLPVAFTKISRAKIRKRPLGGGFHATACCQYHTHIKKNTHNFKQL